MRTKFSNITSHHIVNSYYFCNQFLLHVVQVSFTHHEPKAQSTPRTAFLQEGENDEDMTTMHTTMHGENHGGGIKIIKFEYPNWRSKTYQVRVHLGVQEQATLNWTHKSHTDSVFDILHMHGKLRR